MLIFYYVDLYKLRFKLLEAYEAQYDGVSYPGLELQVTRRNFEILDLDPPNNHTYHYGACHFGYHLALNTKKQLT